MYGKSIMPTSIAGGNLVIWITRFYNANNTEVLILRGVCVAKKEKKTLPLRKLVSYIWHHPQFPNWWNSQVLGMVPVNSQVYALWCNWPQAPVFVCSLCFSFQQFSFFPSFQKKSTVRERGHILGAQSYILFLSLIPHPPLPLGVQNSTLLCRAFQLLKMFNSELHTKSFNASRTYCS